VSSFLTAHQHITGY